MKTYTIKRTVVEHYSVEANSKIEALAGVVENPYSIEVKSEQAVLDVPQQLAEQPAPTDLANVAKSVLFPRGIIREEKS